MIGPARTRIKICGCTSGDGARAAVDAGADAIGVVLAAGSPRRVSMGRAAAIRAALPPFVHAVAVVRIAGADDPDLAAWPGSWVQLHGDEDDETVLAVARRHRVIRAVRFGDRAGITRWGAESAIEAVLVDGAVPGSGEAYDHRAVGAIAATLTRPLILAGGLTPENVGAAIAAVRPWAVDVSSGVESAPGVKDPARIRAFCEAVRAADRSRSVE